MRRDRPDFPRCSPLAIVAHERDFDGLLAGPSLDLLELQCQMLFVGHPDGAIAGLSERSIFEPVWTELLPTTISDRLDTAANSS